MMNDVGKSLIVIGLVIALAGVVLMLAGRAPWLGRLPGDIYVQRGNWSFYFPVVTSLVLSVLLTLLFWLFGRR
jgi:membrane protein implicated in regulation of membrane protease activity